jgi:hypothetical protein
MAPSLSPPALKRDFGADHAGWFRGPSAAAAFFLAYYQAPVKRPDPAQGEEPQDAAPTILGDGAIDAAPVKELRAAYRDLRDAYRDLYEKHHGRIVDALSDRRDDGKKTGGDVPYGYRLDEDGETLLEDAAEQAVIAEAVRLREEGLSLRRIAKELWKQKLRPRPVPKERRRGSLATKRFGEFDPTQIKRMIEAHKTRAKFAD